MTSLSLDKFSLRFGQVSVLRDVSVEVRSEEFVSIVGPSGCGKSTLLNAMSWFLPAEVAQIGGLISLNGRKISSLADWDGKLGYVFQRDALLPWRTVMQNIEVGLEIRGVPREERQRRAEELITMVGLREFADFYPHKISGGMRQRTSLARTLAYDPQIIFMDEPFGALDAHTRMGLQRDVTEIWQKNRKTILLVTHDLAEAIIMAQRVVILSNRPARVIGVFEIPFAYPRDPVEVQGSSEYTRIYSKIWHMLGQEFRG